MFQFAVIFCLALGCVAGGKPSGRILGGGFAKESEFPHQISLQYNGRLHVCGGSILTPTFVITAGHCVTWKDKSVIPPEDLTVRAGTNVLNTGGVVGNVKTVHVHDKYLFHLNDLALLELTEPLPMTDKIKTIKIRVDDLPNEKVPVTVYGWGKTSHNGERSETLKSNTLTALTPKDCTRRFLMDFDQILCFESPVGQGVCQGDSGSGAMYNGELIGVASFVKNQCGSKHPDMYVRLNQYITWINKFVTL